jgi:hypothetical protein
MDLQRALDELVRSLTDRTMWIVGSASNRRETEIMEAFADAGAVTPSRAQRFHAHSSVDEVAFTRLLARGQIREVARGRYYLCQRDMPRRDINWDDLFDPDPLD